MCVFIRFTLGGFFISLWAFKLISCLTFATPKNKRIELGIIFAFENCFEMSLNTQKNIFSGFIDFLAVFEENS